MEYVTGETVDRIREALVEASAPHFEEILKREAALNEYSAPIYLRFPRSTVEETLHALDVAEEYRRAIDDARQARVQERLRSKKGEVN